MSNFIIYAPSYNENIGGSIALHKLCDLINRSGHKAFLHPLNGQHAQKKIFRKILSLAAYIATYAKLRKFRLNPQLITPVTWSFDKNESIVIYPEVIKNNPLKAINIVRWLLYKIKIDDPLMRNGNDIFFYYQEAYCPENNGKINIAGKLQVLHTLTDIYFNKKNNHRHGICYAKRKGANKKIIHDEKNSVLIDNLSHKDIAEVFNSCETFISYDSYTLFSQYAAICGCTSIVVADANVTREEWQPIKEISYGVAYGFEDIEWAKYTRSLTKNYLLEQEEKSNRSIVDFIKICQEHFKLK